MAYISLKWTYH